MMLEIKTKEQTNLESELEFVVDKAAYDAYRAIQAKPIFTTKRLLPVSSGETVDVAMMQHHFEKKIEHLPEKEQTKLLIIKKGYITLFNQSNVLKRKAYGVKSGAKRKGDYGGMLWTKKEEVIELFGRMHSVAEVHKIVVEEWRIPCSELAVKEFRNRFLDTITAKIENHKRNYSDIRLGVKRSRLEELTWLYTTMKEKYKLSRSREDHRVLIVNLDQIRKEIEGDSIRIDGNFDINIESTVNVHLQQEVFKQMNISEIILARVASRMNVSALEVLRRMSDSYYAKFVGFIKLDESVEGEELQIIPPSQVPYDFDKIRRQHADQTIMAEKQKELARAINKEVVPQAVGQSLKNVLLSKIKEKQKQLDDKAILVDRSEIKMNKK